MQLELSLEQYETLMKLLYMGDWIVTTLQEKEKSLLGEEDNDMDNRFAEVVRHVYSQAENVGLGHLVQLDQNNGEPYLTREFEEEVGLAEIMEEYEEDVFWRFLVDNLAHRDFVRNYGESAILSMAIEERIEKETPFREKWISEINEHGLENFKL